MEVLSLCNKLKQLLEIENIEDASDKLLINLLDDNKRSKMIDKWLIFCPDLTKDYMQIIFQEELADRKEKKQDYIVLDNIEWTTEWCDTPGELKFTILKDNKYYNEQRIKEKLNWMSPVEYRLSLNAA